MHILFWSHDASEHFLGNRLILYSPWIWLFFVQKHWPGGCHIESNIREIFFIYICWLSADFTVSATSWRRGGGGTKETIKTASESKVKVKQPCTRERESWSIVFLKSKSKSLPTTCLFRQKICIPWKIFFWNLFWKSYCNYSFIHNA
mgnify:CR=1 FL=1